MPRYRLSSEAQNDIRAIRDYYVETAGARVARLVVTEIDRACRFLAEVPGAGHRREDLTNAPVRFWQVFSFFVIYARRCGRWALRASCIPPATWKPCCGKCRRAEAARLHGFAFARSGCNRAAS